MSAWDPTAPALDHAFAHRQVSRNGTALIEAANFRHALLMCGADALVPHLEDIVLALAIKAERDAEVAR